MRQHVKYRAHEGIRVANAKLLVSIMQSGTLTLRRLKIMSVEVDLTIETLDIIQSKDRKPTAISVAKYV